MRALRIPLPAAAPTDQTAVPAWIIDGDRRTVDDERREAPRLEIPSDPWDSPQRERERRERDAVAEPLPGSTVIVIPL